MRVKNNVPHHINYCVHFLCYPPLPTVWTYCGFLSHSFDSRLCCFPHVCVRMNMYANTDYASLSSGAHRRACLLCLSAIPVISSGPLHPTFPLQPSVSGPSLTMPPIWLEQRVQAGQPSRSLSKAAEYSSSLGVSPPPLRPGLGPFNKEQVIQKEGGGGSDSKGLVGGENKFFFLLILLLFFVFFFFLFLSKGCVGSLPLSTYF